MSKLTFQVGGNLDPTVNFYIERPEDEILFQECKKKELCIILAARMSGKSSLMVKTYQRLNEESGYYAMVVDLQGIQQNIRDIGNKQHLKINSPADLWYSSFFHEIYSEVNQKWDLNIDLDKWWQSKETVDNVQRMSLFLKEIVLENIPDHVVIFIDEIDRLAGRDWADDFFMALRKIYNEKWKSPEYKRLSFVLIGHRLPRYLIENKSISPFNIGTQIEMSDFSIENTMVFAQKIKFQGELTGRRVMEIVFEYTGGHPYLTHEACQFLAQKTNDDKNLFFLSNESQIHDLFQILIREIYSKKHINKIKDWMNSLPNKSDVLRLWGYILEGHNDILFDETIQAIDDLRYSGLVQIKNEVLFVRNKVYEQALPQKWVIEELIQNGAINPQNFSFGHDRLGIHYAGKNEIAQKDLSISKAARSEEGQEEGQQIQEVETQIDDIGANDSGALPANTLRTEQYGADLLATPFVFDDALVVPVEQELKEERLIEDVDVKRKNFLEDLVSVFSRRNTRIRILRLSFLIGIGILLMGYLLSNTLPTLSIAISSPLVVMLIGLLIGLILTSTGVFISEKSEHSPDDDLARYLDDGKRNQDQDQTLSEPMTWLNRRFERKSWGDKIARKLAQADIKLKPGEYIFINIILAGSVGLLFFGLFELELTIKYFLFGMGFLGSLSIISAYVARMARRRLTKFDKQLPSMLTSMVSGLRAGYSTIQAFEAVSKEMQPPISDEIRRVVQEMQLGIPMDKVLENMLCRIPSAKLELMIAAINVQREVGGPLAETLDRLNFRFRDQNLTLLQAERLGMPSLLFFLATSFAAVTTQTLIFPQIFDLVRQNTVSWTMLLSIMAVWSFILITMGMLRIRKKMLMRTIPGLKKSESLIPWMMLGLSLGAAYFLGVPPLLIIWMSCFLIFALF